jgi:hypothetical protein
MVQSGPRYMPVSTGEKELESGSVREAHQGAYPQQWQLFSQGAGQCEYQGFDTWTPQEQDAFHDSKLRAKWGFGQVSIRLPIRGCLQFIAIVYGFLPFAIPIWWFVWVVESMIRRGYQNPQFFPAYGLGITVGFAIVNELITKKLCRKLLPERITARPPEAVCKHPGMPSGHVMNAYTVLGWVILEFTNDRPLRLEWLLVVLLVMGPVPWARVYNRDHTLLQVTVSAVVAWGMSYLAYWIRATHFPSHDHPWQWYHLGPEQCEWCTQ